MRARMALHTSATVLEHREIELKNKPAAMLAASPKGTVPVLVLPDGQVIDESLDIMRWALGQNDPDGWLNVGSPDDIASLIAGNDGGFKHALDRYKYPNRYPLESGNNAKDFALAQRLEAANWLAGCASESFAACPRDWPADWPHRRAAAVIVKTA